MKKIILLFTFFITTFSFAQTANKAIAWSGIITDNTGNVLANTNVTLKFSIAQNGTPIFSEQHNKTTDANGFVNANIGEGTPLVNNLSIVYFDTVNLKLKIEADSGSGFVTLSDDFFKAVPYAKGSETSRELGKNDEFVLLNSNNISFYTNGYQGEINENGLLLDDLAGTGTREVIADANGQLQRKPVQQKTLSISGAAFNHKDFRFHPQFGLHQITGSAISFPRLQYNVNLPDGSKITFVKVVYKDNVADGFTLGLYRHSDSATSGTAVFSMDSNSNAPQSDWHIGIYNFLNNINHIVDNENNSYFLSLESNSWPSGQNLLAIRKIVIYYLE